MLRLNQLNGQAAADGPVRRPAEKRPTKSARAAKRKVPAEKRGDQTAAAELPALLSTDEAARLLGIGARTLWRNSRSGLAPAPVAIGRLIRYRRAELLDWIDAGCPRVDGRSRA